MDSQFLSLQLYSTLLYSGTLDHAKVSMIVTLESRRAWPGTEYSRVPPMLAQRRASGHSSRPRALEILSMPRCKQECASPLPAPDCSMPFEPEADGICWSFWCCMFHRQVANPRMFPTHVLVRPEVQDVHVVPNQDIQTIDRGRREHAMMRFEKPHLLTMTHSFGTLVSVGSSIRKSIPDTEK